MIRTSVPHSLSISPNVEPRPAGITPSILLLHYTGMESAEAARRWLCTPQSRVSCHYLVDEKGDIVQMVGEEMRAWHAGASFWRGITDINSHSIGIEIHNPGHSLGYPDFPGVQMDAVITLSRDIVGRNAINRQHVLAHSDVAPRRKIDPGEKFNWKRLHEAGIGHWVKPMTVADVSEPFSLDKQEISKFQSALRQYGYDIAMTGSLDRQTEIVVRAFQRHFRPERVDGVADRSTASTLSMLLENTSEKMS